MQQQVRAATPKGNSTRDRIMRAARQRLVEEGLEGFSLRELATSLELKLSNVQYYFKTKDTLMLSVFEDEAAADIELIRARQQTAKTPEHAFRNIVEDLVTRWRGDSGKLFATLNTLALHNREFRKLYRSIYGTFYEALETPLRQLNAGLPEDEVRLRVRLVTALIDGSPMQIKVHSLPEFLKRVEAQALLIALA